MARGLALHEAALVGGELEPLDGGAGIAVAHVVGVVGADDDVAGGGGAEQRAQHLVAVDEVVEVEQLEVVAGGLVDDQAGFGAGFPAVVPAADDGLGDAAPVGEADFEVGIAREGAPEDEGGRADAGLDREADEVGGVVAAQAVGAGGSRNFLNFSGCMRLRRLSM